MIRRRRSLSAIALVAALSSPIAAQQPTSSGANGQEANGTGGQHRGMMGSGHDAGIMNVSRS